MDIRVGCGFDVHPFVAGRPFILGGVQIPSERGLLGHSDADVLLHALTDSILGGVGKGDIGVWFPDTDESFRNADSLQLLDVVWQAVSKEGWRLINCDCVVLAERPKIRPHVAMMQDRIGRVLNVPPDRIGIKATTTEKLGFVGREEGVAVHAVALLSRS